jgi:hypothetical protein
VFVRTQLYPFQSLNQLAAEIGRDIVARAAPQELPLYRSITPPTCNLLRMPPANRAIEKRRWDLVAQKLSPTYPRGTPQLAPCLPKQGR